MNVTSKAWFLFIIFFLTSLFNINTAMSETTKPESVIILIGEHDLSGCQSLDRVRGSSEKLAENATYPERLMAARNNLRNQTSELGGDTVLIMHANNTGRFEVPGINNTIIFIGQAYSCK